MDVVYLFLIALLPLCLVWIRVELVNRKARRTRRDRLTARGAASEGDWFDRYFGVEGYSRETSVAVAKIFAERLGCEVTNLRPTDRFDAELRFEGVTFLGLDEDTEMELIEDDLTQLLGARAAERFHTLQTVGDVIAFRDALIESHANRNA